MEATHAIRHLDEQACGAVDHDHRRLRHLQLQGSAACTNAPRLIVAVTADATSGAAERYIASGMDHYIAKPVHLTQV